MKANVGKADQIIRFVLGVVMLSMFFVLDGNLKYVSGLGIVLIFTGLVKFCPLYPILGINTCSCRVDDAKACR